MKKRTLVILGASSMLALGIAAPVAAAAANNDPKSHRQQLASGLAKELGVDEAKVSAALDKLREDKKGEWPDKTSDKARTDLKTRLDEAVKAGKLTQAEADAVLKAVEAGVIGGWGGWGHHGNWNGDRNGHWNGNWNGDHDKDTTQTPTPAK